MNAGIQKRLPNVNIVPKETTTLACQNFKFVRDFNKRITNKRGYTNNIQLKICPTLGIREVSELMTLKGV